jgi:hypothetical protein
VGFNVGVTVGNVDGQLVGLLVTGDAVGLAVTGLEVTGDKLGILVVGVCVVGSLVVGFVVADEDGLTVGLDVVG